jgi:multidrug efflux system outer membrane protein
MRAALSVLALAASAALSALTACGSMAPEYQRPAAPVPQAFPGANASDSSASGSAAADLDWQRFFGDERLKRLIALALQNNRDLRVAALNIDAARATLTVRDADRWPTVSAGFTESRSPTGRGGINSLYAAGVQVTAYEADLWGRLKSLSDGAAAQLLATEEARKALQMALVGSVASAHLALQADDELLRVTQETLVSREASYKLVKLRFDNGASAAPDLRQAESLVEQARVSLAQTRRQRALDENALQLLLGQPGQALPTDAPPALPLQASAGMPVLRAGLPSDVLLRRPDVRQAEQLLMAANANIGAARAAFFPRISLTGSLGSVSTQLSGLFQAGSWAWSFAPSVLAAVFDAGRNQANLNIAQINRDIAVAQYEKAVQTAFREVADALANRSGLAEQLAAQERQTQAEAERTRLADLRYRNGAAGQLEWLDAQRSLLTAQQALVQVQAQLAQSQAQLYRVLGGGWTVAEAGAAR